jgi:hypothetical protein
MERVFIYGYVCIGLMGCALIGMIIFSWVALRKLHKASRQWVHNVIGFVLVLKEFD